MDSQMIQLLNEYDMENKNGILDVLNTLGQGVMIVDKNYNIIYYSNLLEEMESLTAQDVIGKNIFDVFPNMSKQNSTIYMCFNEGKKVVDKIIEYFTFKGKSVKALSSTIPLLKDGEIIAVLDISKDLQNMDKILTKKNSIAEVADDKNPFSQILTVSSGINKIIEHCRRAAQHDVPIVLFGETGTGKELFAQSIHYSSSRKNGPFITLNCAAVPSELIEGILFGTNQGGFTGATDRMGLFEQADGGTLLLDEINSMGLDFQAKLLRVLQEGSFRRVGGMRDISSNVRIIATTNQNLMEAIAQGKFRKDLFYRINVISVEIPPLRERDGDIEYLIGYFVDHFSERLGRPNCTIHSDVMECLKRYSWPGNVRELRNVIEGILCLLSDHEEITMEELPDYIRNYRQSAAEEVNKTSKEKTMESLTQKMAEYEKQVIAEALSQYQSITQAAQYLGLSRQSLQYRMNKLGIRKENLNHSN